MPKLSLIDQQIIHVLGQNELNAQMLLKISNAPDLLKSIYRAYDPQNKPNELVAQAIVKACLHLVEEQSNNDLQKLMNPNAKVIAHALLLSQCTQKLSLEHFGAYLYGTFKIINRKNTCLRKKQLLTRTLFSSVANYCVEYQGALSDLTPQLHYFLKKINSATFHTQNKFEAKPEFFLEAKDSVLRLFLCGESEVESKVEKLFYFLNHYFSSILLKKSKLRCEDAQRRYQFCAQEVLEWLEIQMTYNTLAQQQKFLNLYSSSFNQPLVCAKRHNAFELLNAIKSPVTNHLFFLNKKNSINDVFRYLRLFNFEAERLQPYLDESEMGELRQFLRNNDYLQKVITAHCGGKTLPLSYFVKTLYIDRVGVIEKYGAKHKKSAQSLELDLNDWRDFQTFFYLFAGSDILTHFKCPASWFNAFEVQNAQKTQASLHVQMSSLCDEWPDREKPHLKKDCKKQKTVSKI